jgi:site-specific DNA-methyltransferase (adenine-specific)
MEINKIYNENCLETMAKMPDNFIDLVVTSPPYDKLRNYKGYSFDFENVAKELYRVTKEQGVLVWVVADSVIDGSESGNSFRQALYFKEQGFNLHDTMIYQKNSYPFPPTNRYYQQFEYMFVFSKGKPKTTNLLKCESGNKKRKSTQRNKDGTTTSFTSEGNKERIMDNVWLEDTGYMRTTKDKYAFKHPAMFPESLSEKHIQTWSNESDLVYDCFMGSGTTAKMAILNNRKYIGSEISEEYCKIIETRIKECGGVFFNSFETELSNEAGT